MTLPDCKVETVLARGLGSDDYDPVTHAATRLSKQHGYPQIHCPLLNDVVGGPNGYVAVPSLKAQANRLKTQLDTLGSSRIHIVAHSLGLLVAAQAGLDLTNVYVTAIAPGLTAIEKRIPPLTDEDEAMPPNELAALDRYKKSEGVPFGMIRRPHLNPVIVSKDFMDQARAVDPLELVIPMLQQLGNRSRIMLIWDDDRLGNQDTEVTRLTHYAPDTTVDVYTGTNSHYLLGGHAAIVLGAAVLGTELP